MSYIPGLDRWLTTEPEDSNPSSTQWGDQVCEILGDFYDEYEKEVDAKLDYFYSLGYSPSDAAKKIEDDINSEKAEAAEQRNLEQ